MFAVQLLIMSKRNWRSQSNQCTCCYIGKIQKFLVCSTIIKYFFSRKLIIEAVESTYLGDNFQLSKNYEYCKISLSCSPTSNSENTIRLFLTKKHDKKQILNQTCKTLFGQKFVKIQIQNWLLESVIKISYLESNLHLPSFL